MKRIDLYLAGSIAFFTVACVFFLNALPSSDESVDRGNLDPQCQQSAVETQTVDQNVVVVQAIDYVTHAAKLRESLGSEFTVVVEKPFVVIGDQPRAKVEQWAAGTIRWAVGKIKESYFENDPDHIISIWLFKDQDSYETNAKKLFGRTPTTPYGYYSPSDKVLVMNISTGGGTLVHEIVHPFMAENFKSCPSWFNEGLASLYEQSADREGKIVGLTNWRLRGLQLAIHDGLLPSFEKLMATNDREFYEGDSTNYAQARYLCYWLQENDMLREYYHAFVKNVEDDPSGIKTLKEVLGGAEIPKFQSDWEAYVLRLRF